MTFLLNHCDAEKIAADYALSERLGAEIEAAGCEPLAELPVEHKASWYRTSRERYSNGEILVEVLVERVH